MNFDLQEMLVLRRQGWSTVALGARYNKDHTTIVYHCRKAGLIHTVMHITTTSTMLKAAQLAALPSEERINPGKSYRQYLAESLKRDTERHYQQHHRIF